MWKKITFYFLLLCLVTGTVFFLGSDFSSNREEVAWEKEPILSSISEKKEEDTTESESQAMLVIPEDVEIRTVTTEGVPFMVQAPLGDWSVVYEDACEETSILMIAYYFSGKALAKEKAVEEIFVLTNYGHNVFGHAIDTSAQDTARMLAENYDIASRVLYDMTLDDVKRALAMGNLLIVPANGRKLGNPNFTPPGPVNHMLVITGYDLEKKEFITHDPGTRLGRNYRYDEGILYAAIRDYPTGKHLPNEENRKAMIVIPQKKK